MAEKLLCGKQLSNDMLCRLKARAAGFTQKTGRRPSLALVHCHADSASLFYMKRTQKTGENIGISAVIIQHADIKDFAGFLETINRLNLDSKTDAIIVERPLPREFNSMSVWETLSAGKDADGASALNMGRLFLCKNFEEMEKEGFFAPCTAMAVIKLLRHHEIRLEGQNIAVIGRSSIVGRPLAHMLSGLNATVTLCHSKTQNLQSVLENSQIIISAVGKARWLKSGMIRKDCVLVDVGTNVDEKGKLCGDVDFDAAADKASFITPVPGGVGPVTLACLLENCVKAAENHFNRYCQEQI